MDAKINKYFLKFLYFDKNNLGLLAILPSWFKVFLYGAFGAKIGENVLIPRGTYILSKSLVIGEGSEFGKNSLFEIDVFILGRCAKFEDNINWRCRKVTVGDAFYGCAASKVGWGGEFDMEAELAIGDSSFIGEEAMLNPCRPIRIGNNVAIGAGSKIYTHQFWQSVLEGYEVRFKPVLIEDDVMVGCNCAILPGTHIKRGSTLMANSTVFGTVKEFSLLGGVPAVELPSSKIYPKKLTEVDKDKVLKDIFNQFIEKTEPALQPFYLYRFGLQGPKDIPEALRNKRLVILSYNCQESTLFKEHNPLLTIFVCSEERVVGPQDYISDELREFLRKRGIKFSPVCWRYKKYRKG